jgi:predicted HTH transcriptional regulator
MRRRFTTPADLLGSVYAALVQVLVERSLVRAGPFDASPSATALLPDLDADAMRRFVREARRSRGFPLDEDVPARELLAHLNLLEENGTPRNAAVLLFGREPQRHLIGSELKCAHFHGTETAKPIPSYQVYKGNAFQLVDQALDFVLSKLSLAVGTRAEGPQAPVAYEMPREVVAEAVVNAVAHRDYSSTGSVQVMLFADRLEVWNPGGLPSSLTLAMLRGPHGSVPANPLLAEPLYLARYIERMGTGTGDMIRRCREAGLPDPEFSLRDGFLVTLRRKAAQPESRPESQPESRPESQPESLELRVLELLAAGPLGKAEIAAGLGLKGVSGQLNKVIRGLLAEAHVEWTLPDKPNSRLQKHRLTRAGAERLRSLQPRSPPP